MKIIAIIAFAAASIAASAASAEPTHNIVVVSYADLNLSSEAGRTTLARRINIAARVACGSGSSQPIQLQRITDRCVKTASSEARTVMASIAPAQIASR